MYALRVYYLQYTFHVLQTVTVLAQVASWSHCYSIVIWRSVTFSWP